MKDFSDVYKEYAAPVHRFLLSLTRNEALAEELTQETFYKAFLHIDKFRGNCTLYGWLCQIAKNLYFNEVKKTNKIPVKIQLNDIEHSVDLTANMLQKEQTKLLHSILHKLPEPYKEVFTLKVFGELKFREIASLFEKTESWAKITFYRAKERIVNGMEEEVQ